MVARERSRRAANEERLITEEFLCDPLRLFAFSALKKPLNAKKWRDTQSSEKKIEFDSVGLIRDRVLESAAEDAKHIRGQ